MVDNMFNDQADAMTSAILNIPNHPMTEHFLDLLLEEGDNRKPDMWRM